MSSDSEFSFPEDEFPSPIFDDEHINTHFFPENSEPNSNSCMKFFSQLYPLSFFYGYDDVKLKEYSNKIILPLSILDKISSNSNVEFPLYFYLEKNDKKIYFGVEKFLPDISDYFIPNYIFENLGIQYGEFMELKIDFKTLNKGTKIILEPHDKEFLKVPDPKKYLETHIRMNYQSLSENSVIRILYRESYLDFNVKKVEPEEHVSTLDTDIEVDFEKPLNYVEPPPKPKSKPFNPKPPQNKGFVPFSGKGNKLGSS